MATILYSSVGTVDSESRQAWDSRPTPGARKTVYTLNVDGYSSEITDLTYPLIERYAKKIGARFEVIDERKFPKWPVTYEKLQIYKMAQENLDDYSIYIDSDTLVSPNLFDITEHLPKDTVLHNGSDMAGNRWTYDRFFRRDGRNIGSCNWFTVASNWCRELWKPLDDMTLDEALANIHPQGFELSPIVRVQTQEGNAPPVISVLPKQIITAEHLIDDYVLSRNIAKYGLKFTTLIKLCEQLGQTGETAGYLWHAYTITEKQKVEAMRQVLKGWNLDEYGDESFASAYARAVNHGLLQSEDRARNLWHKAASCALLDGEFWECGVYRGGSAYLISEAIKSAGSKRPIIRLFDTFSGLPWAGPLAWEVKGKFAAFQDWAVELVSQSYEAPEVHVGIVPETFKGLEDRRIAFAHVDVDLYEGIAGAIDFIWPRIVKGGVMLVDDYGNSDWPGVEMAVNERFKPEEYAVYPGQCVIVKS